MPTIKVIEILEYILIKKDMMSDLNISQGKMSDFVSFPLFRFTLVMKLRNFNFKVRENTLILKLIFLNLGICCQIKICPGFFVLFTFFRISVGIVLN